MIEKGKGLNVDEDYLRTGTVAGILYSQTQ